ncbi:MAG: GGDEF domain-containing protein [Saccharospirillum sp.]|nr:GGDEF domain-containing protein [Saccharospirillum sp.]
MHQHWFPWLALHLSSQERLFQQTHIASTRRHAMALLFIGALVASFFLLYSYLFYGEWTSMQTHLGWVLAVVILFIPVELKVPNEYWQPTVAVMLLIVLTLMGWVFREEVVYTESLNAGGPMTVALVIGAMPVFHLGWKLILWGYFGVVVHVVMANTALYDSWTLVFYLVAVMILSMAQAQTDRLLRYQFRVEQLERLKAQTDQLTGSLNRYAFEQHMNELLNSLPEQECLALAMIDIDFFKRYNDHYGHLQGDMALVEVAQALNALPADLVVRFGGEEFVVVCQFSGEIPAWLQQLSENIASQRIEHSQSPLGFLTVSVGLAVYQHGAGSALPSSSSLLGIADAGLYEAKQKGRNQLCLSWVDQ